MQLNSVYKLNTQQTLTKALLAVCLVLVSLFLTNCGKRCQTNTNSVKSLSENGVRWRMVETNDKSANFRKLNNYTFDVWSFDNAFRGQVIAVVNNEEFSQTPKCTMTYVPAEGQMAVKFLSSSTPPADGSGGSGAADTGTTSGCPFSGTVTFSYTLGKNLQVTNIKTGSYYRFVQYLGIVEPDKVCTF